jgi:hypothetical protein
LIRLSYSGTALTERHQPRMPTRADIEFIMRAADTIHRMLIPENIAKADTDGGGTIDKNEFGQLLAASGVEANSADMQSMLLFSEADKDGDGELTLEELKRLVDYKAQK